MQYVIKTRFGRRGFGVWLALIAAFSFSMKAIFVKLAYHWPIEAVTLLALRMASTAESGLTAECAARSTA